MKNQKETIKIVYIDDVIQNDKYSRLRDVLSITQEDIEREVVPDLFYDSDHIKIESEKGRGAIQYISADVGKITYLIINKSEEISILAKDMLLQFYSKKWESFYKPCEPNTWENWDTIKRGIAYRNGSGYVYSLWVHFTN